ncbi:MAG TPA: HD domain-containing phosphohydrolase [Candidatus Baltobacteraceae bacterium]|nr:HD domain-containing phosphohydrolase [Candidatus Baltobacteraceae bacterium]
MNGFAATVERHRAALVDAMVAPIANATVGDEVVAAYLVDGVARRARGESLSRLAPVRVSAADVPNRLGAELARHVRRLDPLAARELNEAVRAVLAEIPWDAELATASETPLDECDVVIAERIAQLDLVDPLTGDHSRAVGSWCRRIAERLGLSRDEALHASRSGLIHDIGKSSVPIGILTAPRRLDADERAIMEAHVLYGEQYVLEHPVLHPFAPSVRSHHERFDGRGYPDGLPGARIPLTTRIVSVADSFNAMIDRRPYRPPRPPSEALLELHRGRGTQFDPDVVDAMIAVVEQHA